MAAKSESGSGDVHPLGRVDGGALVDPRGLALAAQVLIAVETVVQLGVAVTGGPRAGFFARFAPLYTVLFVATVMVFLSWFRRCRLNAELFAPGTHKYAPGFAVGAWFIPVAMWWIPRRIALDIRWAGSPVGAAWLIDAWWVAWLAKTVGGAVAAQLGSRPYGYSIYDDVVGVVAAALAIWMVRQITAEQDAKARAGLQTASVTQASST